MTRRAPRPVDLAEVRRNIVRLTVVQGALLVGVLAFVAVAPPGDATSFRLMMWLAALPLVIAAWGFLYYRETSRAVAEAGPSDVKRLHAANRNALRYLGVLGGLWLAGVVLVILL